MAQGDPGPTEACGVSPRRGVVLRAPAAVRGGWEGEADGGAGRDHSRGDDAGGARGQRDQDRVRSRLAADGEAEEGETEPAEGCLRCKGDP